MKEEKNNAATTHHREEILFSFLSVDSWIDDLLTLLRQSYRPVNIYFTTIQFQLQMCRARAIKLKCQIMIIIENAEKQKYT